MENVSSDKRTGLALGGGAVLGAAHIGVLKVFEEHGVEVSAITGTSMGAFIATLYAFGKQPSEIEKIALEFDWLDVSSFSLSKFGLLSNEKLGEAVRKVLGEVQFRDAEIPLAVVATDIGTGKRVVLKDGDVAMAVMASTCVPGIFVPVEIDGRMLVDGGLVENVPLSPLRDLGAEILIGVDLNAKRKYQKPEDLVDVLSNALDIAIDNATRIQTKRADITIAPKLSAFSRTDAEKVRDMIAEGYEATAAILSELQSE